MKRISWGINDLDDFANIGEFAHGAEFVYEEFVDGEFTDGKFIGREFIIMLF